MRISRKNFSIANSNDPDQVAPADETVRRVPDEDQCGQTVVAQVEEAYAARRLPQVTVSSQNVTADESGDAETPQEETCQSHFFLAPNVRFTRTPDRGARQRASQPEDATATPEANPGNTIASQGDPAPATQPPLTALPPRQETTPSAPVVQLSDHSGDVSDRNGQTAAAASASSTAHLGFLSDHAFFEFMSDEDPASQPAHVPTRQAVAEKSVPVRPSYEEVPVASQAAPAPTGIASLYKVIECSGGRSSGQKLAGADPSAARPAHPAPANTRSTHKATESVGRNAVPAQAPVSMPDARSRTFAAASPALPPVGAHARPASGGDYEFPEGELLQQPEESPGFCMSQEQLERNAGLLESVLEDFKVRGEIIHVRPGPVVTLYEFEPAPGIKSSRIVNLADDIARSMSAISARVAVVPGRNVIGIELPNTERETVFFREMIDSNSFRATNCKLALSLGKTIGGEPVVADLAKMPHLLVAGTTGSGKSVAINTMILSLLYRLRPEECRLIMVDPKMLELSIYDDIPHLLTPVVTDPKKAVTALKWAVREMEDRYRKMARLGVRNINGFNQRAAAASQKGEPVVVTVQAGFDKETGEPLYEQQEMDLAPMPYIVIIVDEMADLMMVAGKEIEGAIQRLAQMARAAGIHLIMATQRPSVDVITGTIKANFPTRISFQVTSKIDSRTILGEQGAEQLLGMGDMLHMSGGGRINRVHGAFVSDEEVEQVVAHLKSQGRPAYLETVTAEEEEDEEEDAAVFDKGAIASEDGNDLYDNAVKIVLRDKRCSTSYIQRRLGIGYNRAATLVERMENEGLVGAPNHVGKREILAERREQPEE
ncbi:DNA translocase FtsK [Rhodobacterales bacterium]|nr:DNA translocase FtsK [Rhodobacterales bacterium]